MSPTAEAIIVLFGGAVLAIALVILVGVMIWRRRTPAEQVSRYGIVTTTHDGVEQDGQLTLEPEAEDWFDDDPPTWAWPPVPAWAM